MIFEPKNCRRTKTLTAWRPIPCDTLVVAVLRNERHTFRHLDTALQRYDDDDDDDECTLRIPVVSTTMLSANILSAVMLSQFASPERTRVRH